MKFKMVARTVAAGAVAVLLAGCGGGGGGAIDASSTSLQVGGTAATGAALANASVQVKCASGTGTATTAANGSYTVTVVDGAMPCLIKVTGTAPSGAEITLHSVTEAGTTSGNTTTAVANVSPITEMIVAQLTAALPSASFEAFNPGLITAATVASASSAVVQALQAAGIDLTGIDPLKSELVPPSGSTTGNAYDDALEKLGETVTPEALPLLVTQIAAAAATTGSTAPTLTDAMAAVSGGALENCPTVLSGKYRVLEYTGRVTVRSVDFKNKKFMSGNGVDAYDISVDPAKPCEFVASGTINGTTSVFNVAIGASGVGAFRANSSTPTTTPTAGVTGYIFPAQAHDVSALAGEWTFLQSGFDPMDGWIHWLGTATVSGTAAEFCDFDKAAGWGCKADSKTSLTIAVNADGGFDIQEPGTSDAAARFFGYRAPNGSFNVFGTTNASGATTSDAQQTHIVLSRRAAVEPRTVGSVNKTWDTDLILRPIGAGGRLSVVPTAQSTTVTAVDTAAGTATRKRESDCRVDTMMYNKPIEGLLQRDAGNTTNCAGTSASYPGVYIVPLTGLGMTTAISQAEGGLTFSNGAHIYSISVQRP